MFETGLSRQLPGLEEMDSLFLGSASLEDAGADGILSSLGWT